VENQLNKAMISSRAKAISPIMVIVMVVISPVRVATSPVRVVISLATSNVKAAINPVTSNVISNRRLPQDKTPMLRAT